MSLFCSLFLYVLIKLIIAVHILLVCSAEIYKANVCGVFDIFVPKESESIMCLSQTVYMYESLNN